MKLSKFIEELKRISEGVGNSDRLEVEMADCVPVVKPVCKDDIVFITDVDSGIVEE